MISHPPPQTLQIPLPLMLSLPRGSGLARPRSGRGPLLFLSLVKTTAQQRVCVCVNVGQIEPIYLSVADPSEHKQEGDVHEESSLGVLAGAWTPSRWRSALQPQQLHPLARSHQL